MATAQRRRPEGVNKGIRGTAYETKRKLKISVLGDRYQTRYNTPRFSRHTIYRRNFIPFNLISHRLEGLTIIRPDMADLHHYHNRIPIVATAPFLMGFESHLPRYFGSERARLFAFMRNRLLSRNCRKIVAMSHVARKIFVHQHASLPRFSELTSKLIVRYPNIELPEPRLELTARPDVIDLAFVGGHFGRKGGAACVRAAEIARQRKIPLRFTIVSTLLAGPRVWSDPKAADFFDPYFRLLDGANIVYRRSMRNAEVLDLFRNSHLTLLPTISDTFGFTAIESLAVGTPVLATSQGALPEFIVDNVNGFLVPLETDSFGEWIHGPADKASSAYETAFRDEAERLAHSIVDTAVRFLNGDVNEMEMRRAARATAEQHFDANVASPEWDELYVQCVT